MIEKYPSIDTPIYFSPRPTTTIMSVSPSFESGPVLEAPLCTIYESNLDDLDESAEYPQLVLLGDSITQFGTLTLQAYLQTQYIRRLDVINRGYSGYTSEMGFKALRKLLPSNIPPSIRPNIKLVTVFFGANDACIPGEAQHLELQTYVSMIDSICRYIASFRCGGGRPEIIVITPPPVNEHQFEFRSPGGFQRRAGITSQYARAATEAEKRSGVCVLDFWKIVMSQVGWKESMGIKCCCERIEYGVQSDEINPSKIEHIPGCQHLSASLPGAKYQLSDFLVDGLHLTKLGYDVLFTELMQLIRTKLPNCTPESLPFVLPDWKDALKVPRD